MFIKQFGGKQVKSITKKLDKKSTKKQAKRTKNR